MSKIYSELREPQGAQDKCFVRNADTGKLYGPVSIGTLVQWAEEGRIRADSEVSLDNGRWVRADSVHELKSASFDSKGEESNRDASRGIPGRFRRLIHKASPRPVPPPAEDAGPRKSSPRKTVVVTGQRELLKYIEALEPEAERSSPQRQTATATKPIPAVAGNAIPGAEPPPAAAMFVGVDASPGHASLDRDDKPSPGLSLSEVVAATERDLLARVRDLREKASSAEARVRALTEEMTSLTRQREAERVEHAGLEDDLKAKNLEIAMLQAKCAAWPAQLAQFRAAQFHEKESRDKVAAALREIDRLLSKITDGPGQARTWRLKLGAGPVYGLVCVEELRLWAAQCRIGPEHEVSHDGEVWQPAHHLSDMQMTWTLSLANGRTYGPLHLSAVSALVAEGFVAEDADVSDAATQRRCKARDLAGLELQGLRDEIERLSQKLIADNSLIEQLHRYVQDIEEVFKSTRKLESASVPSPEGEVGTAHKKPPIQRPVLKRP